MNHFFIIFVIIFLILCVNKLLRICYTRRQLSIKLYQNKYENLASYNISIDNRVRYYMKNTYNQKIYIDGHMFKNNYISDTVHDHCKTEGDRFYCRIFKVTYNQLQKGSSSVETIDHKTYRKPLIDYLNGLTVTQKDKYFLYGPGDKNKTNNLKGVICKSRSCNDQYSVLLKINIIRHWDPISIVNKNDIPYSLKNNKIIWRGVTTGYSNDHCRIRLVRQFYNHPNKNIDIGFTEIIRNKDNYQILDRYLKSSISKKELLKSKFLISLEGNDVSSGLKWQMFSNSVVFMSKPTVCSWFMEDLLIPNYHYILLKDDYSDLEEKYNWALKNPSKCQEITKNANNYVEQFLNIQREKNISLTIMNRYFENIIFNNYSDQN